MPAPPPGHPQPPLHPILPVPPSQPAVVARPRAGLVRTVCSLEWRLARRDAGSWLAVLLLLGCVLFALGRGHTVLAERAAAVAAAQADEQRRLGLLVQQLEDLEAGRTRAPAEAWRDPGNPVGVGRGSGAAIAAWSDAPLAATAVGLSDLHPPFLRVAVGSRDRFLFADEIANPLQLASGSFDLAFVLVFGLPLVLLALSHDVLSGEREKGTWALTAASSAPPLAVLALRLAMRGAGVLLPLMLVTAAQLLWQGAPLFTGAGLAAFAGWATLVLLYTAFWLSLALWVNSWQRSSAFNAVALVVAWVGLVVVVPALVNALAQALHPAPSRAELVLAVRQATVDTERGRVADAARFGAEHGATPAGTSAALRALALVREADRRADEVLARHEAVVQAQRRLTDRLGLLSPPLRLNDALAELAGTGHARLDAHLARVDRFHGRWQDFFFARAEKGERLKSTDIARFPRFAAEPGGEAGAPGSTARVGQSALLLLLATLALAAAARRALRRAA